MLAPIGGHFGINFPCRTVEEWLGPAIRPAGREDPLEGSKLAAVVSEYRFKTGKLLHRCTWFAVIAKYWIWRAVRGSIEIGVWCVEIDGAEKMKVTGVG